MINLSDVRIVVDSSADLFVLPGIAVGVAPLKITTADAEYVDTPALDVGEMTRALASYKGKSTTSCPSMGDFLDAFGDARYVFCITITSKLSGSYGVALSAAKEYEAMYPERRACVIDSRNTGPGMKLLAERIARLLAEGCSYDEVYRRVSDYRFDTELLFLLESLNNLANNGRVNRAVAKIAGLLGIRMLGRAVEGVIKMVGKLRGEEHAWNATFEKMLELGYDGGKLRISHCENEKAARALEKRVRERFPAADVEIYPARALCSFYAERGGIILGFEITDPFGSDLS